MSISVRDVNDINFNDLISVCTPVVKDDIARRSVEIKRDWVLNMLNKYGSVAKIGYFNDEPVAQLLYYPTIADPIIRGRDNVLIIHCIYNRVPRAQCKGIAKALFRSLLSDIKNEGRYKFIITHAFATGEFMSQKDFFLRIGFKKIPGINDDEYLYYSVYGDELRDYKEVLSYWDEYHAEYEPLDEDRGAETFIRVG